MTSHSARQVADMVIEKAKRLVEHKRDVYFADSITRLARDHNAVVPPERQDPFACIDSNALQRPKTILRRGPQPEEGGSLTIIATARSTPAAHGCVIFESSKVPQLGNSSRPPPSSDKRLFPQSTYSVREHAKRSFCLARKTSVVSGSCVAF